MEEVLALRPFVPSKDYEASKAFYAALGFTEDYSDASITSFNAGAFSFFLQNLYVEQFAENCMLQLVVRNLDAWWAAREWEETRSKIRHEDADSACEAGVGFTRRLRLRPVRRAVARDRECNPD